MIQTEDVFFVLVVAVCDSKYHVAFFAVEMLYMVFVVQCRYIGTPKGLAAVMAQKIKDLATVLSSMSDMRLFTVRAEL